MVDRVKAVIHLDHLWHNYQLLKTIHQDKEVMAVVKADAYGHGSVQVAQYLEERGCKYFAVTDLLEAIELRQAGIKSEILIFGKTSIENAKKLNEYNITQTIDSYEYAKDLDKQGIDISTHIILDTGMSRFGIYCHQETDYLNALDEIRKMLALKNLKMKGIYTHFAKADEADDAFTHNQFNIFNHLMHTLEEENYHLGIKHCSNSASILKFDDHNLDMVRSGIAMYGYPPIKSPMNFLPVMEVFAKVIALRDIKKGDGVSYGLTYMAKDKMTIGSIAIGYADGYNRLLSNQDYFLHNNHKLNVLGRVCMGVTMVDVTNRDVSVGDFVEVFGMKKPLEDMTVKLNTITYELLTNMSKKRVVFEYKYD